MSKREMMGDVLTYPQWFALLSMKHFGSERAGRVIRSNTLNSLARRGYAFAWPEGLFTITARGLAEEDRVPGMACDLERTA